MRRPYFAATLLLLALVGTALAEEPTGELTPKAMAPGHCIQQLLQDYPGPNDLYYCVTHPNAKDCTYGEEDMWFGQPSNAYRPQICLNNECEPYGQEIASERGVPPGHGMDLTASSAWGMIKAGLKSAQKKTPGFKWDDAEYHVIPRAQIHADIEVNTDIDVIAVPIKVIYVRTNPPTVTTVHFCLEFNPAEGEETTPVDVVSSKPGKGRNFSMKYKLPGENQERTGLVWLK